MAEAIETNNTPETNPAPTPAAEPETQKTFSEDYVKALRSEAKSYRVANKNYETAFKKLFNLPEGEELGDLDKRITDLNAARQKELDDERAKTNAFIINSELDKAIGEEYNEKLTKKLLDYSKIEVKDGKVTGIKEALDALAVEYPEVKKQKAPKPAEGTGSSKVGGSDDAEREAYRKAFGLT